MINFFTKPMRLMTVVVNKSLSDRVAQGLLKLGVMDFINVKDLDIDIDLSKMQSGDNIKDKKEIEKLVNQIKTLYSQGGIMTPKVTSVDIPEDFEFDRKTCTNYLSDITDKLGTIKARQKVSSQKYQSYAEMNNYMIQGKIPYLEIRVGKFNKEIDKKELNEKVPDKCIYLYLDKVGEAKNIDIFITLRRDGGKINPLLDKLGWIETDDSKAQKTSLDIVRKALAKRCDILKAEHDKIKAEIGTIVAENKTQIDEYYKDIQIYKLCTRIKASFISTKNTSIFSGWVPTDTASKIEDIVNESSKGQCIVEWTDAKEVRGVPIPVKLESPGALSPFAKMVNNYNTPEYGSVNPIYLSTITYLIMFALMFPDVGQGLVLVIVGWLIGRSYKKNPMKKEGMLNANVCKLMIYLGVVAMISGALFGSYFGFPLFKPLWFNYDAIVMGTPHDSRTLVQSIYDILGITIKFGFSVIVIGLVLNWINLGKKRDWIHLFLDKYGITGGTVFIIGYFGAKAYVASGYKTFPQGAWFSYGIGIPVLLLLFKGPINAALKHTKFKIDIMGWLIDLLEIFSGYLSNTLSFMRVAGLGIAHACLMVAFAEMAASVPEFIWKFIILLLGNILVIALEGLSSGIQALRLNYYEFFTKFFTGRGVAYKPVNLDE